MELWYVTRASGAVAVGLLTIVVGVGLLLMRPRTIRPADAVLHRAHGSMAVTATVFLVLHVVTAIADGYVPISWWAAIIPFVSAYDPVAVGLGTVAVDLLLAVLLTSALRHRLPHRVFRAGHWLTYPLWLVAVLHGVLATTSDSAWLWPFSVTCVVAVAGCGLARLVRGNPDGARRGRFA